MKTIVTVIIIIIFSLWVLAKIIFFGIDQFTANEYKKINSKENFSSTLIKNNLFIILDKSEIIDYKSDYGGFPMEGSENIVANLSDQLMDSIRSNTTTWYNLPLSQELKEKLNNVNVGEVQVYLSKNISDGRYAYRDLSEDEKKRDGDYIFSVANFIDKKIYIYIVLR